MKAKTKKPQPQRKKHPRPKRIERTKWVRSHRQHLDPVVPVSWLQPYACHCGNTAWEVRAGVVSHTMGLLLECTRCHHVMAVYTPVFADEFQGAVENSAAKGFWRDYDAAPARV
jgi:hypothetical protein